MTDALLQVQDMQRVIQTLAFEYGTIYTEAHPTTCKHVRRLCNHIISIANSWSAKDMDGLEHLCSVLKQMIAKVQRETHSAATSAAAPAASSAAAPGAAPVADESPAQGPRRKREFKISDM
ncbi:MAG: hypothetical protein EBR09_15755 [Proteobacteria bacterium]|jgi:hypothetical protein|nr:hypothetical protein [Pseudomonadota bacterium]